MQLRKSHTFFCALGRSTGHSLWQMPLLKVFTGTEGPSFWFLKEVLVDDEGQSGRIIDELSFATSRLSHFRRKCLGYHGVVVLLFSNCCSRPTRQFSALTRVVGSGSVVLEEIVSIFTVRYSPSPK